jgi:hypothetical protein
MFSEKGKRGGTFSEKGKRDGTFSELGYTCRFTFPIWTTYHFANPNLGSSGVLASQFGMVKNENIIMQGIRTSVIIAGCNVDKA